MLAREAKKILCKMTSVYCKHETIFSFPFISSYTRYHYPKIKKKEKESKEKKRRVLKHQQKDVQQIKKGVIICSHICINKCCYSTINACNPNNRNQNSTKSEKELLETYSNAKKSDTDGCRVCIKYITELYKKRESRRSRKPINEMIRMCDNVGTDGVVSMYSTLF